MKAKPFLFARNVMPKPCYDIDNVNNDEVSS